MGAGQHILRQCYEMKNSALLREGHTVVVLCANGTDFVLVVRTKRSFGHICCQSCRATFRNSRALRQLLRFIHVSYALIFVVSRLFDTEKGARAGITMMRRITATALAATHAISPVALTNSYRFEQNVKNETVMNQRGFKAPPNVGPGRQPGQEANPYKTWEHMSHKWLILMCMGCLAGGFTAGQLAEVDESKIPPKFDKDKIIDEITKTFEFRPDLAATALRVAFVLAARRAGMAAPSIDESCSVVEGLVDVAGVYSFIAGSNQASMEDIACLTAIAAIKFLKGPYQAVADQWCWGRDDKEKPPARVVPADGAKHHPVATVLRALGGLSDAECVALLGAHAVGEFHEEVTGLEKATHTAGKCFTLDNRYYKFLLAHEKEWKPIKVSRSQDNRPVKDLPETMRCVYAQQEGKKKKQQCVANTAELSALLKDKAWREWVEKFAVDKALWEEHFAQAMTKMMASNTNRLRPYPKPAAVEAA